MKKLSMFLVAVVIAIPMLAQTPPSRVAVINVQKVLAESSAGKVALERLKKMQDERSARAQKMSEEIANLEKEINQKKLSLTDDKLGELQKTYSDRKIALQRFAQDAEREIGESRDRELAALNDKIMPIISEMGKEMGFAVIFNKFEAGLVYASDAVDITDMVIKRFNETQKQATAKP